MLTPRSLCGASTKEFQTPLFLTFGVGDQDLFSLLFISSEINALVLLSTRGQCRTLPCHTLNLPHEKYHVHLPIPVCKAGTWALGAGSVLLSAAVAQSSQGQMGTRPLGQGFSTWAQTSPSAWESIPMAEGQTVFLEVATPWQWDASMSYRKNTDNFSSKLILQTKIKGAFAFP